MRRLSIFAMVVAALLLVAGNGVRAEQAEFHGQVDTGA